MVVCYLGPLSSPRARMVCGILRGAAVPVSLCRWAFSPFPIPLTPQRASRASLTALGGFRRIMRRIRRIRRRRRRRRRRRVATSFL